MRRIATFLLIPLLFPATGCLDAQPPGDGESVADSPLTQTNGPTMIGVIKNGPCPNQSPGLDITIDNENRRNGNSAVGWIGETHWQTNITFRFCAVSSGGFENQDKPYIVLQLQPGVCPLGSTHIMRHFDTEDSSPNISGSNITSIEVVDANMNVNMNFCVFPGGAQLSHPFPVFPGTPQPNVDVSYGVFAASNFTRALASGGVFSDDEDTNNQNSWDTSNNTNTSGIIAGLDNTEVNTVRIH